MSRLSQHGDFDPELLAKIKEEMSGNLEFAEAQEPLARNKAGMPSTKGFIETHFNFGEHSVPFDFATCQRSDGSYYGTGGTCRLGTDVPGGKPKDEKKGSAKSGGGGGSSSEYRTRPKGAIESDMKKLTSSGAMNQKGTAGVKAREEYAKLKAELKKPLQGANSKSGGSVSDSQAKALSKDLTRQISEAAKKGDQKTVDNLMQAKAAVDGAIKARGAK